MKPRHLIFLVMMWSISACKSDTTNSFGIYLTAEPVAPVILNRGTNDCSHLRLESSPVISDADILSYDFTNHLIRLSQEAANRITKLATKTNGPAWMPFVAVADGVPIYLGTFTTIVYDIAYSVPTIDLNRTTNCLIDTVIIQRSWPGASESDARPDPRADERIRKVLASLHKLKEHE